MYILFYNKPQVFHPLPITPDISISLSTTAVHYLQHGVFTWSGGQFLGGHGRVDPRQLQAVLTGEPNCHLVTVTLDQDRDFLSDDEEKGLSRSPADPDEDLDTVPDGIGLARLVACEIAGLPVRPTSNQVYRSDFPLRGLERCEHCGTNVNMGHVTIHNPPARLALDVPYIALHCLQHDSFSFAGNVHGTGRSGVKALMNALFRPGVSLEMKGQQVTLRWPGRAARTYQVFRAPDAQGPWTSGPVYQGTGEGLVFGETQPTGQPVRFFKVVVW